MELDEVYATERQLLYVAVTRARDRLMISGVLPVFAFLADMQAGQQKQMTARLTWLVRWTGALQLEALSYKGCVSKVIYPMSNGISAIKGFDYQATVILDRLFDHFDRHGLAAQARPEGIDDLDLSWTANAAESRRYEQIKKPREDRQGNLKPTSWSLSDAIDELLPNTIAHLSGNNYEQIWIVGDEVDNAVRSLLSAGENAPTAAARPYWNVVYVLARNDAVGAGNLKPTIRKKLQHCRIPADLPTNPADALSMIVTKFSALAQSAGAGRDIAAQFRRKAAQLHECLPSILARTRILSTYGSEQEVAKRVHDRLEQRYMLQRSVIENTLFRNLRGFINDISKQPGRKFSQDELEFELRCVWPRMIPVKDAPTLDLNHVRRPDLAERVTTRWTGRAIEVVGISGSGKTMLAAEAVERSLLADPDRRVYYAEVRSDVGLRDVLVGVAFHLRRIGIPEPFAISVESGQADEETLARLGRSYSTIPQEILLLVDLVEGACSPAFARDLATFIRALSSSVCRIAVFGQESALRELSPLERGEHGVSRLDIRGFRFEEFVTLVAHYHPAPERAALWNIYQHVTAGRAAGLFAGLAQSLARAQSLQEMQDIAARPAEDILPYAEQRRFGLVTGGARGAAEKLVCFALPFRRKDAEEIFPDDNVGAAVRELLTQGLLRSYDEDWFEMHETVRAGLEETIALNVRRSAHEALAAWYGGQGLVTAEILHLEKAGRPTEARVRAREAFLRGERWAALSAYVTGHKLVSAGEAIGVIAGAEPVEDKYLLSSILRGLGEPVAVDELLQILREQPERFYADYQWALAIVQAILEFDPTRLHDLVVFSIDTASDTSRREAALTWLMIAARSKGGVIGPRTIEFFNSQPPETKRLLLRFMLLDRRRDALRCVFQFLASDQEPPEAGRRSPVWRDLALQIGSRDDTVEFLAAMPAIQPAAMLTAKSALLGPLASLVWSQREVLRAHCIEILRVGAMEEKVIKSAIRVLVFLAEPSICTLCDPLLTRKDSVRGFAALVPALVPAFCDRSRYEARLLDCNVALEDRVTALFVLASVGADLGDIYRRLKATETDPQRAQGWDFWFLTLSAQAPFPDAIPLLEDFMKSADEQGVHVIVSALMKLGELPVPAATVMLIRALNHANPRVRQCAAIGLSQRRSRAALASLIDQYAKEDVEALAVRLATAIVASGPRSVADLQGRHDLPATQLWQCILAMRLRDASIADRLITIAGDPAQNWQLRRAAIFAAGRLPFQAALERIVPVVMGEHSPLAIDGNPSFLCHAIMSSILLCGAQGMAPIFARGRVGFVDFFSEVFEGYWKESTSPQGLPTGAEAAGWLFDRLVHQGWPAKREAPDLVLNELNIPMLHSAVLRSLRLSGRPDLIDEQLAAADHVWFAMKCLMERSRAGGGGPELAPRLKSLVEASPFKGSALLHRVIAEIGGSHAMSPATRPVAIVSQEAPAPVSYVSYDDAVRILSGASADFKAVSPLVFGTITAEQCERLIRLADPANDHNLGVETYVPSVQFTRNGHVVAQRRVTYTNGGDSANALIKPATAAANRFGLPIPWHQELMTGVLAMTYIPKYLACLGALNDSDRFYEELARDADALLPYVCNAAHANPVLKYIDARIVPFLLRYVSSGTDEFFEGLCTLALQVTTSEIDAVLAGLFYRWTQGFDVGSALPQHDQNHHLWRGFNRLAEHPRFDMIEGWQSRLASVLQAPIAWYHSQDIVRVLERDPRSYILIESRLFRAANWEHFYQDEIDRLDSAAERLFPHLLED